MGSGVPGLFLVRVWMLLCFSPTQPSPSTHLHLNRFFFLMRRTQGSPQTIKISSGGCVESSSFAPPPRPATPPPPTGILFWGHNSAGQMGPGSDNLQALVGTIGLVLQGRRHTGLHLLCIPPHTQTPSSLLRVLLDLGSLQRGLSWGKESMCLSYLAKKKKRQETLSWLYCSHAL